MVIQPKQSIDYMQSLSNSLTELEPDPEIYVDAYMTDNSLTNPRTKNKAGGRTLPYLTQHYRAPVPKTRGSWHQTAL